MSASSLSVVYNLPIRCDAEVCQCPDGMTHPEGKHFPDGRKYDEEDTEWEIMLCVCCGHQVCHLNVQIRPSIILSPRASM